MDTQTFSGGLSAPTWQEMEKHASHLLGIAVLEIPLNDFQRTDKSCDSKSLLESNLSSKWLEIKQ